MSDYLSVATQAGVVLEDIIGGDDDRYYAIIRGREPGVVRGWAKAAERTVGFPDVVIQKCFTREEAEQAFEVGVTQSAGRAEDSTARIYPNHPEAPTPSLALAPSPGVLYRNNGPPTVLRSFDERLAAAGRHIVENILHGPSAPTPIDPIPGFPAIRPPPLTIDDTEPNRAIPPTQPFLNATARAIARDPDNIVLQESDFSPRGRQMFLPADQRPQRTPSPMTICSGSSGDEIDDRSSIGADTDFGDDSDEEQVVGNSVVLPPPEMVTGPVKVKATIPRSDRHQPAKPYVVQLQLPRDYIRAGVDIETRIRVDNVSQVTVTACGPTVNGVFNVGHKREREEERYLKYRDGQRMNDFVRYHLNAAVAFSLDIPLDKAYDPAYLRIINDMSVVLADVLRGGYAYYAIIRGRGHPGLYCGTWFDIKSRVENDPRAFYQAFAEGRAARRWFRHHKQFCVDLDKVAPHVGTENNGTPAPAPLFPMQGPSDSCGESAL